MLLHSLALLLSCNSNKSPKVFPTALRVKRTAELSGMQQRRRSRLRPHNTDWPRWLLTQQQRSLLAFLFCFCRTSSSRMRHRAQRLQVSARDTQPLMWTIPTTSDSDDWMTPGHIFVGKPKRKKTHPSLFYMCGGGSPEGLWRHMHRTSVHLKMSDWCNLKKKKSQVNDWTKVSLKAAASRKAMLQKQQREDRDVTLRDLPGMRGVSRGVKEKMIKGMKRSPW